MEVRLLSVGTRGFILAASRLAIAAAQFCRPQREKNLWHQGSAEEKCAKFLKRSVRLMRKPEICRPLGWQCGYCRIADPVLKTKLPRKVASDS